MNHFVLSIVTVILAVFLYVGLRDDASSIGYAIDRTRSTFAEWIGFKEKTRVMAEKMNDEDYETAYLQAMLAFEREDFDVAIHFFDQLYLLRPNDLSYYPEYANALIVAAPTNPRLGLLIQTLMDEPERTLGLWLLFARYEQGVHNDYAAGQYYDNALTLTQPGSPLYQAIHEQRSMLQR